MQVSVIARFVDAFIGGFFKTMKERVIDGLLLLGTLIYWFVTGKFWAHFWEMVLPWVWLLCAVIVWHSARAAVFLFRELRNEETDSRARHKSLILSQYGEPFELPKAEVKTYRTKIIGIVCAIVVVCGFCSYAVWKVAYRSTSEAGPLQSEIPFSAAAEGGLFIEDSNPGMLWTLNTSLKTIAPINALLNLRIVNNQSEASVVSELDVEANTTDGQWIKPAMIDGRTVQIFMAPNADLKTATLIKAVTLDEILSNRAMSPKETVTGWILLVYPHGKEIYNGKYRFSIADTRGHRLNQQTADLNAGNFQKSELHTAGIFDLSQYQIRYYQDLPGYWVRQQ